MSFLLKIFFEKECFHRHCQAAPSCSVYSAETALANLLIKLNFTEIQFFGKIALELHGEEQK